MIQLTTLNRLSEAIRSVPLPEGVIGSLGTAPTPTNTSCVRRGPFLKMVECPSCTGNVQLKVFKCSVHGQCAIGKVPDPSVKSCSNCPDRRTDWPKQYDEGNLWVGIPGKRFNPSIVKWRDHYAFIIRNGWKGSDLFIGFLDKNFEPIGEPRKLDLSHPDCNYGREDPRLLVHNDRLTLVFTGVVGGSRILHTNVLVAIISDNLRIESVYCPYIEGRNLWEKNHMYFSQKENLWAVYSINPHRVMRIVDGKGEWSYEEKGPKWNGGELRGGAPPVLVGDEYWSFCHDRIFLKNMITYRTVLYTFSAKPPFRPMRIIPTPILTANQSTKPQDQYCACVWAAGAVRDGDDWVVAHGIHDRWTELHKFSHHELESLLRKI